MVEYTSGFDPGPAVLQTSARPVFLDVANAWVEKKFRSAYPLIESNGPEDFRDAVLIIDRFDAEVVDAIAAGCRGIAWGRDHFDGHLTEWGAGRSEYARGTKIFQHPLLENFPCDGWCDVSFARMISAAAPLHGNRNDQSVMIALRPWPDEVKPLIMN